MSSGSDGAQGGRGLRFLSPVIYVAAKVITLDLYVPLTEIILQVHYYYEGQNTEHFTMNYRNNPEDFLLDLMKQQAEAILEP